MVRKSRYDLIIAGAGPSGATAALYAQHFGLDYLIIDRQDFPRDKVCGDALAPVIFSLLKELRLRIEIDSAFTHPTGFDFVCSGESGRESYSTTHQAESLMFNCRRIDFDHRLFSMLRDQKRFLRAKLKDVLPERKQIALETDEGVSFINYDHLIIATGSGQNWMDKVRTSKTIYASRAYVKAESDVTRNLADFSRDILPGYFWAFPLGNGVFNTGILFHTSPASTKVHEIHKQKLNEYFTSPEILSHTRFPLRVHAAQERVNVDHIVAIGDANHSVDPLFGHGIDTGMLEAREQVRSLYYQGQFSGQTPILQLIDRKNQISEQCKTAMTEPQAPSDAIRTILNYLSDVNRYYSDVAQELGKDLA